MRKRCRKCKELKSLSEFYKAKESEDGLTPICKECFNKKDVIIELAMKLEDMEKEKWKEWKIAYESGWDDGVKYGI